MPRIRTIKPEFWTDDKVLEISITARLFFIGLWSFADDNGVVENKPRQLKARIFPADNIEVEPLIQELAQQKLIILYQADGQNYLMVTNFRKHQVIDKPRKTCLPKPDRASEIIEVKDFNGNQLKSTEISSGKGREEEEEREKEVRSAPLPTPGGSAEGSAPPDNAEILVFKCPHFEVNQEHFDSLAADYPALTSPMLLAELKKAADYATDNKGRFTRRANGKLKNPRLFLRNWLAKVIVPQQLPRSPTSSARTSRTERNIATAMSWAEKKEREMQTQEESWTPETSRDSPQ